MKKLALVAAVGLALSGCGGSGGGNNVVEPAPQISANPAPFNTHTPEGFKAATSKQAEGQVEFVNYDTDTLYVGKKAYRIDEVQFNGQSLSLAALKHADINLVKMNVELIQQNEPDSYIAIINANYTGLVTAITASTLTVNSAIISIDSNTYVSDDIEIGDLVMVSTKPLNGSVIATAIIELDEIDIGNGYIKSDFAEIEGRISNINVAKNSFMIGNQHLNITDETYFDDSHNLVEISDLQHGQWVDVEFNPSDNVAHSVDIERLDDVQNSGTIEVDGIITWLASDSSSFTVNYQHNILVNETTTFEDGASKKSLQVGQEIDVDYTPTSTGNIANNIDIEDEQIPSKPGALKEVEGFVSKLNSAKTQFYINGTLINLTEETWFEYGESIAMLNNGRKVEVDYYSVEDINKAQYIDIDLYDFEEDNEGVVNPGSNKEFDCEGEVSSYDATTRTISVHCVKADDAEDLSGQKTITLTSQTRYNDGLTESTLDNQYVSIDGVSSVGNNEETIYTAKEIERENRFDD
ncbi:hypothetical protein D0784_22140 [Vibrio campbellii]|uniref:DUF5666 domain-containing protein n=1 Tax=Vibrio campbellii TaxID=680 RepID=UPI000EFBF2BA|nr:DUF5666 domain-containing protein [Vibrio campbellii]AYO12013.1 hypothetical protein D0784_22140 [Vibrio campbellii]